MLIFWPNVNWSSLVLQNNVKPKFIEKQNYCIWWERSLVKVLGESTLSPPKIVVTSTIFLQLNFLVTYGHHNLDFLIYFKYIWLVLDLI
jgi:hypothetical protein